MVGKIPADAARRFSVAPMMDWTTRDYRAFAQIIQSMRDLVHQFWENPLQLPNFAEASFPFHRSESLA